MKTTTAAIDIVVALRSCLLPEHWPCGMACHQGHALGAGCQLPIFLMIFFRAFLTCEVQICT